VPVVLAAGISSSAAQFFVAWFVVGLIATIVLSPFTPRRIGGPDGGAEKAIVGVIWVLSGLAVGLYMARVESSAG
jgi:hypothetical protein